jgi:hypothetical protein
LVSAFARRESKFKGWAEEILSSAALPLVTCEAVITEACHMLGSGDRILEAVERRLIVCPFDLAESSAEVRWLMRKYADQPMDLADVRWTKAIRTIVFIGWICRPPKAPDSSA